MAAMEAYDENFENQGEDQGGEVSRLRSFGLFGGTRSISH